jgi:Tfp pilus assembly protein PilE
MEKLPKGFILNEPMIVFVIIDILAAIAISQFTDDTTKGKDKAAQYDAKNRLTGGVAHSQV